MLDVEKNKNQKKNRRIHNIIPKYVVHLRSNYLFVKTKLKFVFYIKMLTAYRQI